MVYLDWGREGQSSLRRRWKRMRGAQFNRRRTTRRSIYQKLPDVTPESESTSKITLTWKNLSYIVGGGKITLLKDIDGKVHPGEMVALMGPSGKLFLRAE